MAEYNPLSNSERIKVGAREVCFYLFDKTREMIDMRENRISGLVEKLNDPVLGEVDFPSLYQYEGVQFLLDNKRVLIADEMGTGKTAQALAAKIELENRLGRKVRTLVVAPSPEVRGLWETRTKSEYLTPERARKVDVLNVSLDDIDLSDDSYKQKIDKSDFVVVDYHALSFNDNPTMIGLVKSKEAHEDYHGFSFNDIATNHNRQRTLKKWLLESGFEYVILDEAHNIKNFASSSRHGNTKEISDKAEYLALLSGTCAPNHIRDFYSLIALLKPKRTVEIDGKKKTVGYSSAAKVAIEHSRNPAVIGAVLRSLSLDRRMESIMRHLTNVEDKPYYIEMGAAQRRAYESVLEDDTLLGLQKVQMLKKALLNPALVDSSYGDEDGRCKFEALNDIIKNLPKDEKIVVYSPDLRRGIFDVLQTEYASQGVLILDGDPARKKQRGATIKKFQTDPKCRVLLMNDVAGEGICLTAANNLIFLDEPFSPGERKQVIGRLCRPGQKKKVKIRTLHVKDTIDDGIREYVDKKNLAIEYVYKGIPLEGELKKIFSNIQSIDNWLELRTNYLYTPAQMTSRLIRQLVEQPESEVLKKLAKEGNGDRQGFGAHLAESLAKSWDGSVLENSAAVYGKIAKGLSKVQPLERMVDIASGFGGLSRALGKTGIVNVDADKFNFSTDKANEKNTNLVGRMTKLPVEDKEFDLALCSMGLDILPSTKHEPGRANALVEANRVLKVGGKYVVVLSGPDMKGHESDFTGAVREAGFAPIPELTGFVRANDKEINTFLYVLTATKEKDVSADSSKLEQMSEKLQLNSAQRAKDKGAAQRRSGLSSSFSFTRADGTREPLEEAIRKYYESREAGR